MRKNNVALKYLLLKAPLKILCFLILSSLLLFGCDDMVKSDHKPADTDVVATVNGENLTVKQIHKGILTRKKQFRVGKNKELKPEEMLYLKTESLNELILDILLQQEAKSNKVTVSPDELDQELAMIKSGYQEGDFAKTLELQKISLPEWEKSFKNNLLIKKLINQVVNSKVKIEDSQLLEYFEENEKEFLKGQKIRASHIMLETEEEAQKILKQLKAKKRKFADLAKEHSLGPEGTNGGDLGYIEPGKMPPELDSVFKLKVNQISNIIRTPYGSHIFKVTEKVKARKMSFDESKENIRAKLLLQRQNSEFAIWIKQVKKKAVIEIDHELLDQIS